MNPGKLRSRISIQSVTRTDDGRGGHTEDWEDSSPSLPAAVVPLDGDAALRGLKLEHRVTHRVEIRYRQGITAANRVRFGSRILVIRSVIDLEERHVEMHLLCDEVVV